MFINVNALDYINIILILIFGYSTTITDLRVGKIRNKHTGLMLFLGILLFLTKIILFKLQGGILNPRYYQDYITNILITSALMFLLWKQKLLNAGDSKLIIGYSALIPINYYNYGYLKFFPGFAFLINTFIPIFIYLSTLAILKTRNIEKIKAMRDALKPKTIIISTMAVFGFTWMIKKLGILFNPGNTFSISVILILLIIVLLRTLKKATVLFITLPFIVRILLKDYPTLKELKLALIILFFIFFIRTFLINLAKKAFVKEVSINALKPGMIISDPKIKKVSKITKDNINKICEELQKKGVKKVKVKTTIPFAQFAFIGALLTIVCRGNFITYLRFLLNSFNRKI